MLISFATSLNYFPILFANLIPDSHIIVPLSLSQSNYLRASKGRPKMRVEKSQPALGTSWVGRPTSLP